MRIAVGPLSRPNFVEQGTRTVPRAGTGDSNPGIPVVKVPALLEDIVLR
jgi:hypothetical protein